ncbi:hypothetical protein A5893_11790 [Pedobacter psychrophilus]|uniref:Competence protein n=1 Tax=Pedobacter psychrophilus TaxID=1826909 RepID=A0A179DCE8_9SPHI|nr:phage holin family protein [Pedobacter psychrophilus]OAQ38725.1 hypothetical protein A5893_11790 [Pedobacter psychrophilus]
MENTDHKGFSELFIKIKDYISTTVELKKLTIIEKVVTGVGSLVSLMVLAIVGLFFLVFLSIGCSIYLCTVLDSSFAGYFIVALFYLIIALIIFFGKGNLIANPLANSLVKSIFSTKKD